MKQQMSSSAVPYVATEQTINRRTFFRKSAWALGGLAVACGSLQRLLPAHVGYGPLSPTPDQNTGRPLLLLPAGFRYVSFGWAGDPLSDGTPTPGSHDGMAIVSMCGAFVSLIRNHEVRGAGASFGNPGITYDPRGQGGTTTLIFDVRKEQLVYAAPSIAGTSTNCAGGTTPWGSWLTCEETLDEYDETHGWIFEVPAVQQAAPVPLKALGRFVHEAVAVDRNGIVYETEDRKTAGFYRFLPKVRGQLSQGGQLQMLKVAKVSQADLTARVGAGSVFPVEWVDIADPQRAHSPGTTDGLGVYMQGFEQGGATFRRLEGAWLSRGRVFFNSTSGGDAGEGQVWEYDPHREHLRLFFESTDESTLDNPDNITENRRGGGLMLCEDGDRLGQRLIGLTAAGEAFPFAQNNIVLHGEKNGIAGDFRDKEWAGATFSRGGRWLFVNIQTPGVTFAITGPWRRRIF